MPEPRLGRVVTAPELAAYLHDRIPLTRAMAVEVRTAGIDGVEIYAPLAPNINHRDTVFGGSASAVAILAAWSAIYVRLQAEGLAGRIVIRRNTMSYERPISTGFTARAAASDDESWAALTTAVGRRRPARLRVSSVLMSEGLKVGALDGEFVVLPP
jgi:thioesterase domain-containing protein